MKELQNFLNKLDDGFQSLKPVEQIAVYGLTAMLLGAITYFVVLPMNTKKISILETKTETLEKALKDNERALKDNEEQKILLKEVERSNESIKEEINNNKQALKYIGIKIKQQHNIKFSASQWGSFYQEVQTKANKHKIKITLIDNQELNIKIPKNLKPEEKAEFIKKMKGEFRAIFRIKIKATASFRNLMEFLVDIEKNKLITKLHTLQISNNDEKTLQAVIEINLWGIK